MLIQLLSVFYVSNMFPFLILYMMRKYTVFVSWFKILEYCNFTNGDVNVKGLRKENYLFPVKKKCCYYRVILKTMNDVVFYFKLQLPLFLPYLWFDLNSLK